MSDFTAKVTAQLDTSKIPSQLSQLESMISKRKFVITVDTSAAKEINHVKSAYSDLLSLQKRINSTRVKLAGLDANKDKAQISALSGQLNRLMTDYNNLHSTVGRKLSTSQLDNLAKGFDNATAKIATLNAKAADAKGVEKLERSFTRLKDIVSQMGKIQLKINGLDASKNAAEISQLTAQFKDLESQYNRLKASLKGKIDGVQSSQLSNSLKDMQNQLSQLDAKAQDTKRRLVEAINVKVSDGSLSSSIAKVTKEYERLATTGHSKLTEVKADIEALNQLQAKLGNSSDVDELVANYDKFNATLKKVKNGLSTISSESKTFASSLQISTLDNKIATWMEKNTKAAKTYGKSLDELRAKLAALAGSGSPVPISSVNAIEQEFNSTVQAAVASGKTGKTWGSTFKDSFASIGKYISASTVFYTAIRGLKDMYQNVVNIDSAMVELKKVTNETDESYNTFLKGTNKKAQEIGTTITGLVSSTADFARLGYNFEESQKLAEVANIYAVVGDEIENVDVATESIISTMKAFNINANDSISIVDKFNEVGNNFAISSGGIGEAMKRSASSMAAAGNTIDETIALITAANTVVQNPEKVGTAFKTISMRIRGAKTELEEAGESTEGMAESTAKLQKEIKALSGVDIMKNKDEFKSTYQILDELAQKWGGLTDIQQASIIELLAGKHQGNVMASLMNNFDEAREALAVSMGSDGSAMKEHEKWLDSVEAKQLQLKAAWEGLSQDFLSADFVKFGVDALRGIVNGVDAVVNALGSFGTVLAGVGAFGLKKFIGAKGLAGLVSVLGAVPAPALAAVAAITAIGVAIYKTKKYSDDLKIGATLEKDAAEIKEHSDRIVELNNLMSEVEALELIINTPTSTQEQIDQAKQRLEEIAALVNEKYELNISADTEELKTTLSLLTNQQRGEMVSDVEDFVSKLNKTKYSDAKKSQQGQQKKADDLSEIYYGLEKLVDRYGIVSDTPDSDKKWSDMYKVEQEISDYYKKIEDMGYGDLVRNASDKMYGLDLLDLGTALADAEKDLGKTKTTIENFEKNSKSAINELAKVLTSDAALGDDYGIDTDVALFEKIGTTMKEAGASTDYLAQKYAIAKQGAIDLNSAIESGKLDAVVEDYLNIKDAIGETADNAVRGAALLKQGFTEASQVTSENMTALYDAMRQLGEDNGVQDFVKNAIEGTAILASGFNSLQEVIDSGDTGITKFLSNVSSLKEHEGIFTADMGIEEKSKQLTEFAHSVGLIPDDKSVKIDVDTGEISVITDVTKKINDIWGSGDKTLNVKVNTEVDGDNIDDFEKKVDSLNNKDCTVTFNADGSPARAVIGDVSYDLSEYDESKGTATLYAEGGEAIATIDLVNGKIELLPDKKVISFEATYNGTKGISEYAKQIDALKGRGNISFNIDVNGNADVLDKTGKAIAQLQKDENIVFHVNADGDLEVINTLNREIQVLNKNGDVKFNVYASVENLGEIEGLKGDLAELNGKECVVTLSADKTPVSATIGEVNYLIQDYDAKTGTATLTAENGQAIAAIDLTTGKITAIPDKTANVDAKVTGTGDVENLDNAIENTNSKAVTVSATTSGESALQGLKSLIDSIKSKVVSVVAKVFGGGEVDGTAHVNGTAFAGGNTKHGNWGKKGSGIALGGELGEELVVRDGKFFTIGSDSAEFFTYRKDDIIFNAEQTKQIFEKGKITHGRRRGRAFAEGSAANESIKDIKHKIYLAKSSQGENVNVITFYQEIQTIANNEIDRLRKAGYGDDSDEIQEQQVHYWDAQKEINDYNEKQAEDTEKARQDSLENYLKDSERLYKVHQNESKYINDLQWGLDNLAKTEDERIDINDKIEQAYKDSSANIIKDIEHNIDMILRANPNADVKSYYKDIQREAHNEAERLRAAGYAENSDEIQEQQKIWWDANEKIQSAYQDSIIARYDKALAELEHKANALDAKMQKAETNGLLASTRYYEAMSGVEQQTLEQLKNERVELINSLNSALESGEIAEYSEAWYTLKADINEVTEAILDSENALADFDKKMRQITWDRFDYAQNSFSNLGNEADFLIELLGDDFYVDDAGEISDIVSAMKENSSDWWDASSSGRKRLERSNVRKARDVAEITGKNVHKDGDGVWWIGNQELYSYRNGQLNDAGMAAMGLHGLKYNVYMEQSLAYEKELAKIESDLANNPYDTNLIARKQELLELQRESILAAQDEKQAIRDMVEEGISVELDALQELIDKYNESLDSAKDLYDYQQSIAEHTNNIASIQKQLSAYENDSSEETKAKIQQLKVDLEAAEKDLRDAEYDKYIADQKELLDNIYSEYEETLNKRLDNVDGLVNDMIDNINSNSSLINSTLVSETEKVGTKISKDMSNIWTSEDIALNKYLNSSGSLIGGFTLAANGYFESSGLAISGMNTTLSNILTSVNTIMEYASIMAQVDVDPEGSKNKMIQNSLDWWAASDDATRNSLSAENEKYGAAFGYTKKDGSWYDSDGNLAYSVSDDDKIRNVISKMKANSANWSAASASERKRLEQENENYASKIASITGKSVYKDGDGVWWIDDKELYSYKTGGLADFTGAAWLDGTPNKPELVLNAQDTENFIALKDTLRAMSEQGLSLSSTGYANVGVVSQLSKLTSISDILSGIRNQNGNNGNKSIGDINISIPIEHVDDYNDFITQLQKDKQFEKFIRSVSVDLLSGGSSLAKNKYKW